MGTQFVRKEVGSGEFLPSPKLDKTAPGTILVEGYYKGAREVALKDGGKFTSHDFDVDGKTLSLSSGQLTYKLKDIAPGTMVEVTFLGKKKVTLANGKVVNANQFSVVTLEEVTEND